MNKTDTIFVFMELTVSRESVLSNPMDHYISEPVESHGVWGITEPMRTGIKRGGDSWCCLIPAIQ